MQATSCRDCNHHKRSLIIKFDTSCVRRGLSKVQLRSKEQAIFTDPWRAHALIEQTKQVSRAILGLPFRRDMVVALSESIHESCPRSKCFCTALQRSPIIIRGTPCETTRSDARYEKVARLHNRLAAWGPRWSCLVLFAIQRFAANFAACEATSLTTWKLSSD